MIVCLRGSKKITGQMIKRLTMIGWKAEFRNEVLKSNQASALQTKKFKDSRYFSKQHQVEFYIQDQDVKT